jgi:hypothetical protein
MLAGTGMNIAAMSGFWPGGRMHAGFARMAGLGSGSRFDDMDRGRRRVVYDRAGVDQGRRVGMVRGIIRLGRIIHAG